MPARPWYPRNPGDYRRDTAHLTLEQHGAYNLLLDFAWDHDGVIPKDYSAMARILGVHTNKARSLWVVLAQFWYESGGGFRQKRVDKELRKALDISRERAEAGKRGGLAKAKQLHKQNASMSQPTTTEEKDTKAKEPLAPTARPVDKSVGNGKSPSLWDVAREQLGGPYLGKLIRDHGEKAVEAAIVQTLKKRPAEWKSFLTRCLKTAARATQPGGAKSIYCKPIPGVDT